MSYELDDRRAQLREWRTRLEDEHQRLQAENLALANSIDLEVIREHHEQLRRHLDDLRAYTTALEEFHRSVGPIGD